MRKKSKGSKKQKNSVFFLVYVAGLVFLLAVFFGFRGTLADTDGWAKGIWNNYVVGHAEDDPAVPPAIGWLASRGGLTLCVKGGFYGLTPAGSGGDNPRIIRGAAWFGVGSRGDSPSDPEGVCQNDGDSLGWLNFDQGSPGFCPGLVKNDDCHAAEWHDADSDPANGFAGYIDGWAQISSMMPPKSCNGTVCPENGWVRIYNAKVDSTGTVTNESNYAWNSGEETAIPGNSGLGWIKLDGLKINNCSGHPGCKAVEKCRGWKVTASTPVSDICTSDSTGFRIIDDTHWKCRNECEETPDPPCRAEINDPQDGVCGSANGENFCGKGDPVNLCNPGKVIDYMKNYSDYTWSCGDPNGCGGKAVSCRAVGNNCGWIETQPSN